MNLKLIFKYRLIIFLCVFCSIVSGYIGYMFNNRNEFIFNFLINISASALFLLFTVLFLDRVIYSIQSSEWKKVKLIILNEINSANEDFIGLIANYCGIYYDLSEANSKKAKAKIYKEVLIPKSTEIINNKLDVLNNKFKTCLLNYGNRFAYLLTIYGEKLPPTLFENMSKIYIGIQRINSSYESIEYWKAEEKRERKVYSKHIISNTSSIKNELDQILKLTVANIKFVKKDNAKDIITLNL